MPSLPFLLGRMHWSTQEGMGRCQSLWVCFVLAYGPRREFVFHHFIFLTQLIVYQCHDFSAVGGSFVVHWTSFVAAGTTIDYACDVSCECNRLQHKDAQQRPVAAVGPTAEITSCNSTPTTARVCRSDLPRCSWPLSRSLASSFFCTFGASSGCKGVKYCSKRKYI